MPTPKPSRLLLVKSPFLLVRFVIFSLLVYLGLTALGFAAWEVGASRAAGVRGEPRILSPLPDCLERGFIVNGAPALLIFTSIATSLCIAASSVDVKISSLKVSMAGVECLWTGVFSSLQIAASVFVTLVGPPESCEAGAPLTVCASTTILVPVSWLSATLLLGYFIAITTLCITHLRLYPALWSTPLYDIAWFVEDNAKDKRNSAPQLPPINPSTLTRLSVASRRHSTSSLPRDVENQVSVSASPDREKPLPSPASSSNVWWGRLLPGRAGKDHPFSIRRVKRPEFQWEGNEGNLGYGWHTSSTYPGLQVPSSDVSQFPLYPSVTEVALNEDEPIPLGDRSQWVRAARVPKPYAPRLQRDG
ncbi:hypothetical protein EDB89DRAFT_1920000 [Lactarius sanguifluus]|nr:hypothetical protein EDB89DRAFT_1920000 [Lactarius sanguifluus]